MANNDRSAVLVRFPPELLEEVEAWAEREKMLRHAAILSLIRHGLSGAETMALQARIKAQQKILDKIRSIAGEDHASPSL